MNNNRLIFSIVLLVVFAVGGSCGAAQLYINELLKNDPYVHILETPIVREKKPLAELLAALVPEEVQPLGRIALTFDDGPDATNTAKILDILDAEEVTATFFVVGERVTRFPALIKRIYDEGHLLANHSKSHSDLGGLTNEEIIELELDPTSRAVENITGFYPMIMRPPYGSLRTDSVRFLIERGWQIVRWSLDTFDWDSSRNAPEQIIRRVLDLHHPNAIVLMHCTGHETVAVLPELIGVLRDLGYHFVTVTEF